MPHFCPEILPLTVYCFKAWLFKLCYLINIFVGDCEEYTSRQINDSKSGSVQSIYIYSKQVETYCTFDGWTVIQSRGQFNNSKDFFSNKLWDDYKAGFGTPGTLL